MASNSPWESPLTLLGPQRALLAPGARSLARARAQCQPPAPAQRGGPGPRLVLRAASLQASQLRAAALSRERWRALPLAGSRRAPCRCPAARARAAARPAARACWRVPAANPAARARAHASQPQPLPHAPSLARTAERLAHCAHGGYPARVARCRALRPAERRHARATWPWPPALPRARACAAALACAREPGARCASRLPRFPHRLRGAARCASRALRALAAPAAPASNAPGFQRPRPQPGRSCPVLVDTLAARPMRRPRPPDPAKLRRPASQSRLPAAAARWLQRLPTAASSLAQASGRSPP